MLARFAARCSVICLVLVVAFAACTSGSGDSDNASEGSVPASDDGVDPLPALPDDVALPIVFVHGFAGSAQQYESQALRFAANGYPLERILAYDHDGAGFDLAGYAAGVDQVVDEALAAFGADRVYLVGHSRGTMVSSVYLRDPARAAKVAKYIAIDGAGCPDSVPCLAPTQRILPGQAHVEVATSKESFAMQYEFLVGESPEVVDIVPQRDPVELSGRAVNFPANTGREGATLDVWTIDARTGARTGSKPHAAFELGANGDFGPLVVESGAHYEYVLSASGSPVQHHLYLQPSVRSSRLVRLLSSPPDGATRANTNVGTDHAAIIAIRMREWYAGDDPDLDGDERDVLEISTGDEPPVNAVAEFVGNGAIGLHLHDDAATPGQSTLAALPYFSDQPFRSGVDVFMPASDTADGTITVTNIPRGVTDKPQTFNVPNWPSDRHSISVVFTDYPVDERIKPVLR
ncbi:MAG: alpha/beta fold hydrolase [Acidimicrobiia bacterium]